MNSFLIGSNDFTGTLLGIAPPGFLLIDDGPIADAFLECFPKAKLFAPSVHSFNPLKGIDYKRARDFADILYSASPQGENTLTVRNGRRALVKLLLANTTGQLDGITGNASDPAIAEALATIDDLLVSPVLRSVLCGGGEPFRFGRKQSVVARLDRAELGDFDALILALFLIGQHKGQVILSDGGFYLRPLHMSLMRQDRLTVGLRFLSELPLTLRHAVLAIEDKRLMRLLPDDAETLIGFTEHPSGNPKNLM